MNPRTAIITGGRRGIGLGIARALATEGLRLVITGTRDETESAEAVSDLEARGAETMYCRADVSDRTDRERLLCAVTERFGVPNVLVNNAGIAPRARTDILDATEESFDEVMNVNLRGPYFLTQAVARRMVSSKESEPDFEACIINVSSVSATVASYSRGEYCLSKAGISMATRLWAARLGDFGIPVYEIRPGIVRTDMTAGVEARYNRLMEEGLLVQKRWGLPADVGKAAAALVRGDLPYSTGQVLLVDGGLTLPRL